MIVIKWGEPRWACDICYSECWGAAAVLFTTSQAPGHYPAPLLACSGGCERKAEVRLTAGDLKRMEWAKFLQGLTKDAADATA